ncbi:acetyl-CoA C-acyltransferase [Shimazuella sp. AN120528]|uniref:acetyl-CoA C-acyltransferase n=1 Tax=Shimazuella soli TaxID=1892854 RepID=UPI001F0EC559|nr:acetyl-CoA C-acyltransferase [Shimazuella soli]MCH5586480.1 acetyl-CoA C-acyltransferase [Shimazuella soli]
MREAVIVAAKRSAVGKASRGALRHTRPDDFGALVLQGLLKQYPQIDPKEIDDIIIGCAFPEGEQGMNFARTVSLRAGLPVEIPAMTINRYCSSGLQSIALASERIMCGFAEMIIAGGIESMSMVPMGGSRPSPNPYLMVNYPETYLSMGHTAEEVARRYQISRQSQDQFALGSHQKAAKAQHEGKFTEEIIPIEVTEWKESEDGAPVKSRRLFSEDEGIRLDTSLEALAKLRPAFQVNGTVTAGNSSQTSDGAAAVIVMSREKAEELGLKPLAVFRGFTVAGVEPEVMGIGPVRAIPKLLKQSGVTLEQIDRIELNEAFASQSVAIIQELNLDESKVNVNGGAIALGHPLGCTGTKLTVSILHELIREKKKYGIVTMCIGGGMGAAGLFERV